MNAALRLLGATSVLTLVALVAACGGSGSSDDAEPAGATSRSGTDAPGLGEPTSEDHDASDEPEWLFALTADSASVSGDQLVLVGTSPTVAAFTDRPERSSRVLSTPGLLAQWSSLFAGDPPNASLSGTVDGQQVESTVEVSAAGPGDVPGEVRLSVRPLGPVSLPASLDQVTVVVDDVQLGSCTPRLMWYDELELPPGVADALAGAVRFELDATDAAAPVGITLDAPEQLQLGASPVAVAVSASTSTGPVASPGPVQVQADGPTASVAAPASWVGSGRTATAVQASATLPLPGLAGASLDCTARASLVPS